MALRPARAHLSARAGTEFFDVAAENEEVEVC
jgi:hypothetical protein